MSDYRAKENTEIQLIEAAAKGCVESFGKLCEKYYNPMAAIAYSILADHHLAEDAAQETFARAIVNLNKLKNKEKFAPWIAQICRNIAKDLIAKKMKNRNIQNSIKTENNNTSQNHMVTQAINALTPAERELIILRYYNNMSHQQMANILSLTKPAVNNRLIRTKQKIEKYLKNKSISEAI